MSVGRKVVVIAASLAALAALNYIFEYGFGDFQINPYYARIINLIGINVTLAVSLNLINGLAGQFSIGHAGFMAVGGYTATYLTVYHGKAIAALAGSTPTDSVGASIVMIPSLLAGAAAAAAAETPKASSICFTRSDASNSVRPLICSRMFAMSAMTLLIPPTINFG